MRRLDARCYDRGMKPISRSTFVATTAALAGSSLVAPLGGNPAMAASTKPSIVFAHGIWADGFRPPVVSTYFVRRLNE
jgi:hypothetical protein